MSVRAMEYKREEIEPEGVIEAMAAIVGSGMLYFVFMSPLLVRAFPVLGAELIDVEGYPSTLNAYIGAGFVFVCVVGWILFRGYGNGGE